MKFCIDYDINGNKVVRCKSHDKPGFSIQTNGILEITNELSSGEVPERFYERVRKEINEYVTKYGTKRQREIMG